MAEKSRSGKNATLFNQVKGVLIAGDAATPLADNSWFLINAVAGTSTLPFGVGYIFKSPEAAGAITPALGDDVYPLTLTKICKADLSISTTKGTIDTTDDCSGGYDQFITDGFANISGSVTAFLKFGDPGGDLNTTQTSFANRFFDILTDDGAGVYTITVKNDDDVLIGVLNNSDQTAVGDVQVWTMIPAILSGSTTDKPLKGVQNFDFEWQKAEGPASIYKRTTNATEVVF